MENNNEEKLENKKEIKIKLKALIIIGIIIILIIVGVVIFVNISKSNSNTKGSSYIPSMEFRDVDYKPIIYLYPKETTELTVKLGKPENITCSYPKYNNSWNIIANSDGTLIDKNSGRKLYSLYWEGIHSEPFNYNDGFIVKGDEVIEFLEEKLAILGLSEIEAEEFIVYWLPKLQENEYNYIRFATIDEINKNMPLEINPKPDTIIRVLMTYKVLDKPIDVQEQNLETPNRTGFVVVEWGGTEMQ